MESLLIRDVGLLRAGTGKSEHGAYRGFMYLDFERHTRPGINNQRSTKLPGLQEHNPCLHVRT